MKCAVVILAGGAGRRIGGDKPLKLLRGERLIDRAVIAARRWSDIAAVAVREPGQVGRVALPCILDDPEIEGPLGGLAAALRFARLNGCAAVLTVPADMPFVPLDLGERLVADLEEAASAIASSGGHVHPVCALWRVQALDAVPAYLTSGRRSLKGLAEAVGYRSVEWSDGPLDPFFNINSPEDLAAAEGLLGSIREI